MFTIIKSGIGTETQVQLNSSKFYTLNHDAMTIMQLSNFCLLRISNVSSFLDFKDPFIFKLLGCYVGSFKTRPSQGFLSELSVKPGFIMGYWL